MKCNNKECPIHKVKGTGVNELGDNEKETKNEVLNFTYFMKKLNLKCKKVHSVKGTGGNDLADNKKEIKNEV